MRRGTDEKERERERREIRSSLNRLPLLRMAQRKVGSEGRPCSTRPFVRKIEKSARWPFTAFINFLEMPEAWHTTAQLTRCAARLRLVTHRATADPAAVCSPFLFSLTFASPLESWCSRRLCISRAPAASRPTGHQILPGDLSLQPTSASLALR